MKIAEIADRPQTMQLPFRHAMVSGAFGSLAGVFGKSCNAITDANHSYHKRYPIVRENELKPEGVLHIQVFFFTLMVMSNMLVVRFYARALQESNSSLTPTVISTATNYVLSAILGRFLFGEITGAWWWCGYGLVILGMTLLAHGNDEKAKTE